MATADEYAAWIVKNADKKGTPEFDTVAAAYQDARGASKPAVKSEPKSKPFGEDLTDAIKDLPRQAGLTARYGLEGVGDTLDMLASPIRAGLNVLPGVNIQPGGGRSLANAINLPQPRDSTERVVGDITRTMAGSAVPLGVASKVSQVATSPTTQAVARTLAANPLQQIASGAGAGGAGGYTRETGGSDGAQFLASLAGGVAVPMAVNKIQQASNAVGNVIRRATTPTAAPNVQVDVHINNALKDSGITLADLPQNVAKSLRNDVTQAMRTDGTLSPDAVRRLADYRLTNTTPRASTLTLDPAMVSQEKNLAKIGINSKDPALQTLGRTENTNNNRLIEILNDTGAGTADTAVEGGRKVIGALSARNDRAQSLINDRYNLAKDTSGRNALLDPRSFSDKADSLLTANLRNGAVSTDIRNKINAFADGSAPLNVDTAEQFKTAIGNVQRKSVDGAERDAIGYIRQALDDTPLLPGQELGKESIDAFNKARKLNRAWMNIVDKTPALQAVRDGIEPDKFVQQFVIGNGSKANIADLEALRRSVKSSPEALAAAKSQIAAHLKDKALNGAADEVGNFSQSAFNKALNQIGDEKLALFFKPSELQELKAAGRVASYEQFQPKGSAVNNSNTTGTAIANILDRIGNSPLLSKIPFGNALAQPAVNISSGMQANRLMDAPSALMLARPAAQRPNALMLSPAAFGMQQDKRDESLAPRR